MTVILAGALTAVSCLGMKEQAASSSMQQQELQAAQQADSSAVASGAIAITSSATEIMNRTSYMEQTQPVPESTATLTVGLESLRDLPEGAAYRATEGQASVELRRQGDEIMATGHCDSIGRLYSFYFDLSLEQSREIDSLEWELNRSQHYRLEAEKLLEETKRVDESSKKQPPNRWFAWVLTGFFFGIAAGFLTNKVIHNAKCIINNKDNGNYSLRK